MTDTNTWFKERTFHHSQFAGLAELVRIKQASGLTVSVGLPTLNVADTIEPILRSIRDNLQRKYPLVDQLAVIDTHSRDGTIGIARRLGVEVYQDDELLRSMASERGKGEALWKSLDALTGDLIVWVDSDIKNFHPRFVYGILGPLLTNPEIGYVKAFYQRPIKEGTKFRKTGGGRVTELVTRPLLNLFYPELAQLIQPLSGEYGGRREILESVPFFTGYAVETALTIEIYRQFGLMAIAQVDLEKRLHHNQPLSALSQMSFGILQATFKLLDEDKKIKLKASPATILRAPLRSDGRYSFENHEVRVVERPPIKSVPEYRARRRALKKRR